MSTHDEIRAALEAATPGPWETYPAYGHLGVGQFVDEPGNGPMLFIETGGVTYAHNDADAHLIANAPAWLAELLAENECLKSQVTRLRNKHHDGCAWCCASTTPARRGEGHRICSAP